MESAQSAVVNVVPPKAAKIGWWGRNERKLIPYVFLTPFLIIFLVFTVYPVVDSFIMSLHKVDSLDESEYVGLDNYIRLVTKDARFGKSLINASVFAITTVFLQ